MSEQSNKEKVFYKGEGELQVTKMKHHGIGRKAISLVAGGIIGYALFGKDSKKK